MIKVEEPTVEEIESLIRTKEIEIENFIADTKSPDVDISTNASLEIFKLEDEIRDLKLALADIEETIDMD